MTYAFQVKRRCDFWWDAIKPRLKNLLSKEQVALFGALILTLWYTGSYLNQPGLPGNTPQNMGWLEWWDQSNYYKSARALAKLHFDANSHWYPMGYSIILRPFIRILPNHIFFFVDLACLLLCYGSFLSFARRVNVSVYWAVPLFILSDAYVFDRNWVIPWTSTPLAALTWLMIAIVTAHILESERKNWRLFVIGLLAGTLPVFRPADVLIGIISIGTVLGYDIWKHRFRWKDILLYAFGGLLFSVPYLILHISIYGFQPSPYMTGAGQSGGNIGFYFGHLGWKAFTIFCNPMPWYDDGTAVLKLFPWMAFSFAGILLLFVRRLQIKKIPLFFLTAILLVNIILYLGYIDFLPTNLWDAIHYWALTFPGLALLGFIFLRQLFSKENYRAALLCLGITLAILSIQIMPLPSPSKENVRMVYFPKSHEYTWQLSYYGHLHVADSIGSMTNVWNMRVIPAKENTLRVMAMQRDFEGPVSWVGSVLPTISSTDDAEYYSSHVTVGWPCWAWPYSFCQRLTPTNFKKWYSHKFGPIQN
jgi:hypothetical protein